MNHLQMRGKICIFKWEKGHQQPIEGAPAPSIYSRTISEADVKHSNVDLLTQGQGQGLFMLHCIQYAVKLRVTIK